MLPYGALEAEMQGVQPEPEGKGLLQSTAQRLHLPQTMTYYIATPIFLASWIVDIQVCHSLRSAPQTHGTPGTVHSWHTSEIQQLGLGDK